MGGLPAAAVSTVVPGHRQRRSAWRRDEPVGGVDWRLQKAEVEVWLRPTGEKIAEPAKVLPRSRLAPVDTHPYVDPPPPGRIAAVVIAVDGKQAIVSRRPGRHRSDEAEISSEA